MYIYVLVTMTTVRTSCFIIIINRWKCEVVHEFRNEDPNCASLHPTGFQVSHSHTERLYLGIGFAWIASVCDDSDVPHPL